MEGEGVYTWKNGIEFRGNYKNDLKHGKGIYTVPNQYGLNKIFLLLEY